jgi:RecA-family ATPase
MSIRLDPSAPDGFLVNTFSPADDPIACKDYVRQKLGIPFKPNGSNGSSRHRASNGAVERALMAAVAAQDRNDKPADKPKLGRVVATYDYTDRAGELLYQSRRFDPKTFRLRRPDGNGGWIPDLDGIDRRVLYRWPELLKYPSATVFVTEGESDADRVASLGHCATTVASGKWTPECVQALAGRDVVILQDNDKPGVERALEAAQQLHGTAASVRVVLLPDLPPKGDVSDWLDADPQRAEKLVDVCFDVPLWDPGEATPSTPEPESTQPLPRIQWMDMSKWDDEPRPQREWAILDRVPLKQVGLFSGEGGTGKSIIEMMKDVAHVTGKDWMGSLPELGAAFYIGAEDDEKEIHIRFYDIAQHYGITFKELIAGGLYVLCKLGQDATLCALTKSGKVETTDLYQQIYEAAGDIKPKNISIDTLSRAFAGNEIDRVQVYAFAMHMQALAMVAGGSVTILSHPSLQGIASGTGISGSTAWHGAFRFRQYLKGVKPSDGEQPESDPRELEFKKNQYGPLGETVVLQYRNGLFLPVAGLSNLDKLAREAKADEVFLDLLKRFTDQGRNTSHNDSSRTYAPAAFAKEVEAKKAQLHKADFEAAMRRLFASGKIYVENYGRPSRPYSRLALK